MGIIALLGLGYLIYAVMDLGSAAVLDAQDRGIARRAKEREEANKNET